MSSQTSCSHPCAASLQRRPWQLHRPTRSCTRPWGASPRRTRPARPGVARCPKARVRSGRGALGERVSLAHELLHNFRALQDPVGHDMRYTAALQEFTRSSILAFECNWSEASLERELAEHPECGLFCCIVWLTLLQLPRKTVPRFQLPSSSVGAGVTVSAETTAQWGGFVCLIVFAYLEKRWAWYNLERLQLEILVSSGRAMPPAAVAELAQLVYTTLHQVAPQWPSK